MLKNINSHISSEYKYGMFYWPNLLTLTKSLAEFLRKGFVILHPDASGSRNRETYSHSTLHFFEGSIKSPPVG
jgi:hypothetical protein